MKKISTLISFLCFSIAINAQNALPNPGFENWTTVGTHLDPDNWNTLNPNTSAIGVLTCTKATGADVHTGNSAIKLVTKSVFGQNANGLATTGTISISPPGVSGGVAFADRPDSIVGWYKYSPVSGDNGFVEFQLLGSSSTPDTIGYVRFNTPNSAVGAYTRFSAAINYRSTNQVAKSIWILSSSNGFNATVNSTMFIDDLELITNSGLHVKSISSDFLSLSPNPVINELTIENTNSNSNFILFDATGKAQITKQLNQGKNKIDLSLLANGVYFYSTEDENRHIQKGKILVSH